MSNDESTQELNQAHDQLKALPAKTRSRILSLVRRSSEVRLAPTEVEQIAAMLLAIRGEEGLISSLEAGYTTFRKSEGSGGRPLSALSPKERRELLAALMASRHTPPPAPEHERTAEP